MLILKSELMGIYKANDFTDKATGNKTIGRTKIQLLEKQTMKDGSLKMIVLDVSIPDTKKHLYTKEKIGKVVEVEVSTIGDVKFYGI